MDAHEWRRGGGGEHERCRKEYTDHLLIVVFEWTSGVWCAHVIVCVCVCVCVCVYVCVCIVREAVMVIKATVIKVLFTEMYVNVVFVICFTAQ